MAPDLSAQAAQDDDSEPQSYFVGECGHRVPGGPAYYVGGPYGDADPKRTARGQFMAWARPGCALPRATTTNHAPEKHTAIGMIGRRSLMRRARDADRDSLP
jgi:hypothetical protein